jgi:APA family basic amino acid/polyamine antiporter
VTTASLSRRLGTADAVVLGLASMIGAGVFTVFAPAAAAAGSALLLALLLAAAVAFCNATSTAQLAAAHPVAGGAYAYGRTELGPWWGFLAGWSFVIGKTASCAAMATAFGAYVAPGGWERPFGIAAVAVLTLVNCLGITRTASAARAIVSVAVAALIVAVAAGFASWRPGAAAESALQGSPYGILQAAGLLFFAFAGYARIATLGEEVRDPAKTIPRAIGIAFAGALLLYLLVAVALLGGLGVDRLSASAAPLAELAERSGWPGAAVAVGIGAAAAALGALLALTAGISRTMLAMAREADLPRLLAHVHPGSGVPRRAQLAVGIAACLLVALTDLRTAIGFSSFGVLLYYFVANLSALRQAPAARRYPRLLAAGGAIGCLLLVATVPLPALLTGIAVLAAGIGARLLLGPARNRRSSS